MNADNIHRYDPNYEIVTDEHRSKITLNSASNQQLFDRKDGSHWDPDSIVEGMGAKYESHTWRQSISEVVLCVRLPRDPDGQPLKSKRPE